MSDKNNGKLTKVLGKNNNRDDILSLLSCDLDIRNAIKGIVREGLLMFLNLIWEI